MCVKHYKRLRRYGSPLGGGTAKGDPLRFFEAALAMDTNDCTIWPFGKGYGNIRIDGKSALVHREICRRAHGDPPTSKHQAAHSCGKGKQGCINRHHLRWATAKENDADKIGHGTKLRGESANPAKLTNADVVSIASRLQTQTQRSLAQEYNVSECCISMIAKGKNWGWLTGISTPPRPALDPGV